MALILAYADITSTLVSDADGSPINVQSTSGVQTIDYYTAELRFSGRAFDRMDWTVGGFYYDGESVNNQIVSIPFLGFVCERTPLFPFDDPNQQFVNTDNVHENNNESVLCARGVRHDGQVGGDRRSPLFERREGGRLRQHPGPGSARGGRGRQHRLQVRHRLPVHAAISSPTRAGRQVIGRAATTRVRSRRRRSSRSMPRIPRRTSSA